MLLIMFTRSLSDQINSSTDVDIDTDSRRKILLYITYEWIILGYWEAESENTWCGAGGYYKGGQGTCVLEGTDLC